MHYLVSDRCTDWCTCLYPIHLFRLCRRHFQHLYRIRTTLKKHYFFVCVPLNVKVMMNLQYMLYNLVISSRELDKYVYENVSFFFFFSFWVNRLAPPHPISQSLWTLRGNMTARIFVCWACLFTLIPSQMLPDIAAVSSRQLLLKLISQCLQEEGAGEAGGGGNLVRGGNYEIWQRGRQAFWHSHSLGLRCDV